ncbi:MAG TPA: hypothetical protein VFF49_07010 [Thermodesulfobacteriota bacterium]|nr:hypothetical protein [Thermodesulfobacteriota bacterium]
MITLEPKKVDLEWFINLLDSRDPFTFVRYGDGEFQCILDVGKNNCDNIQYSKNLRRDLLQSLHYADTRGRLFRGILAIALRSMRSQIEFYLSTNKINIAWIDGTFMVAANRKGNFKPVFKALSDRKILYVGPNFLRNIPNLFAEYFVEVDRYDAFSKRQTYLQTALDLSPNVDTIAVSMGPAAKNFCVDLYELIGSTHTIIDFGSIFDGYCGMPSRRYMQRDTWKEIMQANLA